MSHFGCDRCWSSDASVAWRAIANTAIEKFLIDESHYIVSIRKRRSCSQRYLWVMTEMVDWEDGQDPSYRTVIPIDKAERGQLTAFIPADASVIEAVGPGRRSLKFAWPKGKDASIYCGTGVHVGPHD